MNLDNSIVYEQPVNERIRTFLRLEQLFKQTLYFLRGQAVWDTRNALTGLFEILETVDRSDLKGEAIKELERFSSSLTKLQNQPNVDGDKLTGLIENSQQMTQALHQIEGKPGSIIREHELFKGVRHKTTLPGGPCSFDMPAYHHWLQQPLEQRHGLLVTWLKEFESLYTAISLILTLIRQSAASQVVVAERGSFQKALNANAPVQLIRIAVSKDAPFFPEISAGKHQFNIQFKEIDNLGKVSTIGLDVEFELASCAF